MEQIPVCKDCKQKFVFEKERKDFFEAAKYFETPLFCPECFAIRLQTIWEMPGQRRVVICDSCGIECKLHFVPADDQAVFCRECHKARTS